MPRVIKASWVSAKFIEDSLHVMLIRELMAYHCLCPHCCKLLINVNTGEMQEDLKNSALHWSRCYEWPWALINAELCPEDRVLDAGGGHGVLQYAVARRCNDVTNIDMNLKSLQAVNAMKYVIGVPHLELMEGDLLAIPFPEERFNKVFCISVLEHMSEWRKCLDELFRVLCPGGTLLLTLDVNKNISKPSGEFFITKDDIQSLLLEWGWTGDLPETGRINTYLDDGSRLNALCLKIQK